jgi:hypothetical protein
MSDLKPTLLLATALFLASAPEPDSRTVAEMTANFIVPRDERALQAAEGQPEPKTLAEMPLTIEAEPDIQGDSASNKSIRAEKSATKSM